MSVIGNDHEQRTVEKNNNDDQLHTKNNDINQLSDIISKNNVREVNFIHGAGSDDDLVDTEESSDCDAKDMRSHKRVKRVFDKNKKPTRRSSRLASMKSVENTPIHVDDDDDEDDSEDEYMKESERLQRVLDILGDDDLSDDVIEDEDIGDDIFFLDRKAGKKKQNNNTNDITKKHNENPVEQWKSLLPGCHVNKYENTNIANGKNKNSKKKHGENRNDSKNGTFTETPVQSKRYRGLGRKILVFAHHVAVLDALESCLHTLQVKYVRIDGQVTAALRGDLIQRFQKDDEVSKIHSVI